MHSMVYGMTWRAWHSMVYGTASRAWHGYGLALWSLKWYMVKPGGHRIWYGLVGMECFMVWSGGHTNR